MDCLKNKHRNNYDELSVPVSKILVKCNSDTHHISSSADLWIVSI